MPENRGVGGAVTTVTGTVSIPFHIYTECCMLTPYSGRRSRWWHFANSGFVVSHIALNRMLEQV